MTRKFLTGVGAVLAAAGLTLAGCSSQTATDATNAASSAASSVADAVSGDRGPITFAMGSNDKDKITPIIDAWNAEHPDEQVTFADLGQEADAQREKLVQSLQAGQAEYDVMALDVVWTGEFAANQWVAPLTGDLATDTSALLPATVDSATYNGTLYGLPMNTNGQLLFRNTDVVADAPTTWAELAASCEGIETDCLITQLKQYEGLTVNTAGFMEGWGGSILADDGTTPNVDADGSKAGLQALVDGVANGTISGDALSATEEETNLAFTEGRVAYAINWPYMYDNAVKAGMNLEVTPLVGKNGVGVSTLGGYNTAININSKYKATALDFMKFIVNAENQKAFAEASFPPVLASIYDDPAIVEQFPYMTALKASLEAATPRPVSPFYTAISKAIQDNAAAAISGDKDVDTATADMKAAIEQASA
ncbi:MAG: ABC transporter substrate-binding protein [Corynebacterium sp.]|nr:ABC transporter substrate-binding protein [Corynebacterium sp.]